MTHDHNDGLPLALGPRFYQDWEEGAPSSECLRLYAAECYTQARAFPEKSPPEGLSALLNDESQELERLFGLFRQLRRQARFLKEFPTGNDGIF